MSGSSLLTLLAPLNRACRTFSLRLFTSLLVVGVGNFGGRWSSDTTGAAEAEAASSMRSHSPLRVIICPDALVPSAKSAEETSVTPVKKQ